MHRLIRFAYSAARAYRRFVLGSFIASLLITYLVYRAQNAGRIPEEWWFAEYLVWLIYLLLVMLLAAHHWYATNQQQRTITIGSTSVTWYVINAEGDVASDLFHRDVRNASHANIRIFQEEKEGFRCAVVYRPGYSVESKRPRQVRAVPLPVQTENVKLDGPVVEVYMYEQHLEFQPALAPGEAVSIFRKYDVKKSEAAAFSRSGTYFGMPVPYPTRSINQRLIAPPHHYIEYLDSLVLDPAGIEDKLHERHVGRPHLASDATSISWEIMYPRLGYRYWCKYRLVPLPLNPKEGRHMIDVTHEAGAAIVDPPPPPVRPEKIPTVVGADTP